jgi:quinol monooxygenase YgiN
LATRGVTAKRIAARSIAVRPKRQADASGGWRRPGSPTVKGRSGGRAARKQGVIIVTGEILARSDTVATLTEACLAHVRRSRTEPGCLSHHVHVDLEDPMRLVFIEQWASREELDTHFRQVGSIEFVRTLDGLAAGRPRLEIFTVPTR